MRTKADFAPCGRATFGFDRLFDLPETGMRGETGGGCTPLNIVKQGEDKHGSPSAGHRRNASGRR